MKRRNVIILMISLSLILLLGSSYALLRSREVGSNPYVINVGSLQVTFDNEQTDSLELNNMYPMSDKEGSNQSKELGFTVKNTGTVASYYDITLEETSVSPEFKSVIRFIRNKDSQGYNEPKTLSEDKYIDVGGYLEPNKSSSYKVKVWLDYNADNTYMNKEFKAKVVVNSFQESEYAKDVIKSKLVKYEESSKEDFSGGLVAVNTDGDLYNETDDSQEIREYRYSGTTVNNYVTFNDELWRIIGVFKDETGEENIKIVRDSELPASLIPINYKINSKTYILKNDLSSNNVYWYNKSEKLNDWTNSGLQYYLNTKVDESSPENKGYMSYILYDNYKMIRETTYYLGNVFYYMAGTGKTENDISDSFKSAFSHERENTICDSQTLENFNEYTCSIWPNNKASWKGKIGLVYVSDYLYSRIPTNWNLQYNIPSAGYLYKKCYFAISPSSVSMSVVFTNCQSIGGVQNSYNDSSKVMPTLYLKSNVKITSGTGEESNPYKLSLS